MIPGTHLSLSLLNILGTKLTIVNYHESLLIKGVKIVLPLLHPLVQSMNPSKVMPVKVDMT